MKMRIAFGLAVLISLTLGLMSAVASWQRRGSDIERVLWVIAGVSMTVAVHILPAMLRSRSPLWLAWAGAFAVVIFGHAQFFTLSEIHAGRERAAKESVSDVITNTRASGRTAATVATDLAKAASVLPRLPESRQQAQQQVIAALQTELETARQAEATVRADMEKQEARQADPVGWRMGKMLGKDAGTVMLLVSLATAIVLECLAIAFWRIALQPEPNAMKTVDPAPDTQLALPLDLPPVPVTEIAPPPANPEPTPPKRTRRTRKTPPTIEEAIEAVNSGKAKATVTDIRKHLGCSQQKAMEIARELKQPAGQLMIAGL